MINGAVVVLNSSIRCVRNIRNYGDLVHGESSLLKDIVRIPFDVYVPFGHLRPSGSGTYASLHTLRAASRKGSVGLFQLRCTSVLRTLSHAEETWDSCAHQEAYFYQSL